MAPLMDASPLPDLDPYFVARTVMSIEEKMIFDRFIRMCLLYFTGYFEDAFEFLVCRHKRFHNLP